MYKTWSQSKKLQKVKYKTKRHETNKKNTTLKEK